MTEDEREDRRFEEARKRRLAAEEAQAMAELAPMGPIQGPKPAPGFVDALRERLAADEAQAAVAAADTELAAMLSGISEVGRRQIEALAVLPCRGELARIPECSDTFAAGCDRRAAPSCPRVIAARDDEQARALLRERLAADGVPADAIGAIVGRSFYATQATAVIDEFLAGDYRTLLMVGSNQLGKSVAGAYAIKQRGGWFVVPHVLEEMTGFDKDAKALRRRAHAASLLVLDDLGMEHLDPSGKMKAVVLSLLVERHNDALRTIVTLNLTKRQFADRYKDQRLFARIKLMGLYREITDEPRSLKGRR